MLGRGRIGPARKSGPLVVSFLLEAQRGFKCFPVCPLNHQKSLQQKKQSQPFQVFSTKCFQPPSVFNQEICLHQTCLSVFNQEICLHQTCLNSVFNQCFQPVFQPRDMSPPNVSSVFNQEICLHQTCLVFSTKRYVSTKRVSTTRLHISNFEIKGIHVGWTSGWPDIQLAKTGQYPVHLEYPASHFQRLAN